MHLLYRVVTYKSTSLGWGKAFRSNSSASHVEKSLVSVSPSLSWIPYHVIQWESSRIVVVWNYSTYVCNGLPSREVFQLTDSGTTAGLVVVKRQLNWTHFFPPYSYHDRVHYVQFSLEWNTVTVSTHVSAFSIVEVNRSKSFFDWIKYGRFCYAFISLCHGCAPTLCNVQFVIHDCIPKFIILENADISNT